MTTAQRSHTGWAMVAWQALDPDPIVALDDLAGRTRKVATVDAGGHVAHTAVMPVSPALLEQLLMLGECERVDRTHAAD